MFLKLKKVWSSHVEGKEWDVGRKWIGLYPSHKALLIKITSTIGCFFVNLKHHPHFLLFGM